MTYYTYIESIVIPICIEVAALASFKRKQLKPEHYVVVSLSVFVQRNSFDKEIPL